jgi:integrase
MRASERRKRSLDELGWLETRRRSRALLPSWHVGLPTDIRTAAVLLGENATHGSRFVAALAASPGRSASSVRPLGQELLGHADLTTTMRYAHVEAHDLKTGIARLEIFVASQTPEEPPPDSGARRIEKARRKAA